MSEHNNNKPSIFNPSYWLETRVKFVTMLATMASAIIGLGVAWHTADLPRLAYKSEVTKVEQQLVEVQQFTSGTRLLILNGEWFRISAELKEKRARLKQDPFNVDLIEEVTKLEQSLREIEEQIKQLKKAK